MPEGFVDAMAHLDDPRVEDPDGVLTRATGAGVEVVVNAGVDPLNVPTPTWRASAVDIRWAYGIHPQAVRAEDLERQLEALVDLLARPAVVAIGELGLDGRRGLPARDLQERALRAQLTLAGEHRLPVILHCVRRLGRLVEILEEMGPLPAGGLVHGFSGPAEMVEPLLRLGLCLSFGGLVTRASSKRCRAAAVIVPADRLLVESDTPDHPPAWCQGPSEPAALRHVVGALAQLRGAEPEAIAAVTARNARRVYGLRGGGGGAG